MVSLTPALFAGLATLLVLPMSFALAQPDPHDALTVDIAQAPGKLDAL
jgi:hypothetical protein